MLAPSRFFHAPQQCEMGAVVPNMRNGPQHKTPQPNRLIPNKKEARVGPRASAPYGGIVSSGVARRTGFVEKVLHVLPPPRDARPRVRSELQWSRKATLFDHSPSMRPGIGPAELLQRLPVRQHSIFGHRDLLQKEASRCLRVDASGRDELSKQCAEGRVGPPAAALRSFRL